MIQNPSRSSDHSSGSLFTCQSYLLCAELSGSVSFYGCPKVETAALLLHLGQTDGLSLGDHSQMSLHWGPEIKYDALAKSVYVKDIITWYISKPINQSE